MTIMPRLLNPAKCKFSQLNKTETRYDQNRRTPINLVVREEVFEIDCQVKWNTSTVDGSPVVTQAGTDEQVAGYVVLLMADLKAKNKILKKDDKLVSIAGAQVDFYVQRLEYGSHYGGEFKIVKVHFYDKRGKE